MWERFHIGNKDLIAGLLIISFAIHTHDYDMI